MNDFAPPLGLFLPFSLRKLACVDLYSGDGAISGEKVQPFN